MRIGLESGETVIAQACDRARTAALNFGYQATRIVCRLGLKNRPVSRNRIQAIETIITIGEEHTVRMLDISAIAIIVVIIFYRLVQEGVARVLETSKTVILI